MLTQPTPTFIAGELILAGARVKFGADTATVVNAGINDAEIGTAILHCGKDKYASGTPVGVKLLAEAGGRHVIAAGAVVAGGRLKRAANGKVDDSGAGTDIGWIANEAASADGDTIEAIPAPVSPQLVTDTTTNGSASGAADLAALKAETEAIGDTLRSLIAAGVALGQVRTA